MWSSGWRMMGFGVREMRLLKGEEGKAKGEGRDVEDGTGGEDWIPTALTPVHPGVMKNVDAKGISPGPPLGGSEADDRKMDFDVEV